MVVIVRWWWLVVAWSKEWRERWKLLQTSIAMVLEQLAVAQIPSSLLYFITYAISLMYSLCLLRSTPLDPSFFVGCFCVHATIDMRGVSQN